MFKYCLDNKVICKVKKRQHRNPLFGHIREEISKNKKKKCIGLQHSMKLKVALDKDPRSKVQWNWAFLLVKSFKMVSRPLNKGPRPRQLKLCFSFHSIILEGNQFVWTKKNNLTEISWFGEPKCNLGSKGAHFLFFFLWFF